MDVVDQVFRHRSGSFDEAAQVGWAEKAREVIEARIATYPPGSVHFNLLAIRSDPLPILQTQLAEAQAKHETGLIGALQEQLMMEQEKRDRWAVSLRGTAASVVADLTSSTQFDNSVRRHNHLGLIHALLLGLGQAGGLDKAVDVAKARYKELKEKDKGEQ